MKPFCNPLPEFDVLNGKLCQLVENLFAGLKPDQSNIKIEANVDLSSDPKFKDSLAILTSGNLTYSRAEKQLFNYEPGDLIGVERMFYQSEGLNISSALPVVVNLYSADIFFKYLVENPEKLDLWSEILVLKLELASSLLASTFGISNVAPTEIFVEPGQVIISEGEIGTDIFCLLNGQASVSIADVKVGQIKEDEVFGVLAAMGGVPRTATVTADSECRILVVKKEDFAELVKIKPEAIEKVMHDTARAVGELNLKVAKNAPTGYFLN